MVKRFNCYLIDISALAAAYCILIAAVTYWGHLPVSLKAPLIAVKAIGFPWPKWFQYSFLASLGVGSLIMIFNPFRMDDASYGGAHFATEPEIKKLGLRDEKGVILAVKNGRYIRTDQPLSVLVYAPPGSGKTAGIIIPSLLSCGNSAIVHDPKGELLEKTGPRRSEFSRIVKFSPGDPDSAKWNPFSKKELPESWDDVQVVVDRIAASLITEEKGKTGDYWTREARSVFIFWALYLINRDGETSLPKILNEALATGDPQETTAMAMDEMEDLPDRIKTEANGLLAKADKEFASVLGTFKSFMNVFLDARVSRNLAESDFSLWDLRKEPMTIYLTVKNTDQTRLKTLLSLFFELATLTMLDHEPTGDEQRVTLFLDEFVRLARMQEVLEMPAIGRSYKMNAVYICQSFSQIVGIYGQEGADQLKNTCSYHVFFAQNEQKVADDISKSIGNRTRKRKSYSTGGRGLFKNNSESGEGVALVLPQEIMSLKNGRVLIAKQNAFETPVDAKAAFWFKDSALKRLVN